MRINSTTPESSRIPLDELEGLQASLRAYAGSLLGHAGWVEDVVQDANVYLLENEKEFQPGCDFRAWAYSAVYFKVLAWKRDHVRNREDAFGEATLECIARTAQSIATPESENLRVEALKACLDQLDSGDRALLEWKYADRRKLSELARGSGCSVDSFHQKISRLRQALRKCIRRKLERDFVH